MLTEIKVMASFGVLNLQVNFWKFAVLKQ